MNYQWGFLAGIDHVDDEAILGQDEMEEIDDDDGPSVFFPNIFSHLMDHQPLMTRSCWCDEKKWEKWRGGCKVRYHITLGGWKKIDTSIELAKRRKFWLFFRNRNYPLQKKSVLSKYSFNHKEVYLILQLIPMGDSRGWCTG